MKFYRAVRALWERLTEPTKPPSAAGRNFLRLVEAEGGFLFENDERLVAWAEEFDEASRLGLFAADGGLSVGYRLTLKGERFLKAFNATSPAALMLDGLRANGSVGAGLVLARDAEPEH